MPDIESEFDKFLNVLERMDKLRNYVWGLCVGLFMLGVLWANNTNTLNNLVRENETRRQEIQEINEDRKQQAAEWRSWREGVGRQLGRIEALLDSKKGE